MEDSLAANGSHIILLKSLGFRFLGVKPSDHVALFRQVAVRVLSGEMEECEGKGANGLSYGYRYTNGVYLNESH